jgi:purine-binding chemotaxis protein CheW
MEPDFGRRIAGEDDHDDDELQFVSFKVADQEYAISIDDVQEIVRVPAAIVRVPHAEPQVLGVMTLRNRLLPLVSLRRMFALPARDSDDRSRIMVLSLGNASVGVMTDSVNEVLRVARTDVEVMPAMPAGSGNLSEVSQICRLDGDRRLVCILSVANMFRHSSVKEALAQVNTTNAENEPSGADDDGEINDDEEQVVVFRLGKEEFGLPIASVQEIVRVSAKLTRVPKAPAAIEGVINLRGAVLPVMDLRRCVGLESGERSDQQRIIVLLIDGIRTGFIVDSVAEVLKIRQSAIEATPRLSGASSQLLARTANLEKQKRMVQLIEPKHLYTRMP